MRRRSLVVNSLRMKGASILLADSTITLNEREHAYHTMVLNSADGVTVTLPAATGSGAIYNFIVGVTVTSSDEYIIQAGNTTDEFHGGVWQCDTDTTDTMTMTSALDADGYDTITMDGSTTGGIMGDRFEIIDYAAGKFLLKGLINYTGDIGTLLSAT